MEELRAAIANASWPRALELALAAWRATRAPALADLIDAIDAQLPALEIPRDVHDWWLARATPYDPLVIGALVRCRVPQKFLRMIAVAERHRGLPLVERIAAAMPVYAWEQVELIDRLAYMVQWPDDPRTARALTDWFVDGIPDWRNMQVLDIAYRTIAERLIALGDVRGLPRIAASVGQPRGANDLLRAVQSREAEAIVAGLAPRVIDPAEHAAIAERLIALGDVRGLPRIAASVGQPRGANDLLRAVQSREPGDDGPRSVLADYLVERRDPRGELIVAQLSTQPRAVQRARSLLTQHWYEWLGDVALVITRRGSEFQRGMLTTIRVGMQHTPPWAFAAIRGHRELGAVRTVRPNQVAPDAFVELLAGLEHVPDRIGIDTTEILEHMAALRRAWPIRVLEYGYRSLSVHGPIPDLIARLFPALEELRFVGLPALGDILELAANLEARLPRVQRLVVELSRHTNTDLVAALNGLPRVELVYP